jgi:hypothetical protein
LVLVCHLVYLKKLKRLTTLHAKYNRTTINYFTTT